MDVTDETWGVILNRSADDVCLPSDLCKAIVSGFLIKRAGVRDEDGLIRLGVGIVCAHGPIKPLLKAVLGMYRNLALLAKVRGTIDKVTGIMPLHLAAARRARRAVEASMRWGQRSGG